MSGCAAPGQSEAAWRLEAAAAEENRGGEEEPEMHARSLATSLMRSSYALGGRGTVQDIVREGNS